MRIIEAAIGLAERRLAIVEPKLAKVAAMRVEEHERLGRRRAMLGDEASRSASAGERR